MEHDLAKSTKEKKSSIMERGPQTALPTRHKLKLRLYVMDGISYAIMCPEFLYSAVICVIMGVLWKVISALDPAYAHFANILTLSKHN